jgi:hypothetical protein
MGRHQADPLARPCRPVDAHGSSVRNLSPAADERRKHQSGPRFRLWADGIVRRGGHRADSRRLRCREADLKIDPIFIPQGRPQAARDAVAQLFRALAGGYELRADVDSVKRREGCLVRDCGELVAVQLGQVVCRHQ